MTRVVDLFCGAGGESTGIIRALDGAGERYDLAAVNHWDVAMQTHRHNHPAARHFVADLSHLNPHEVFGPRDHVDLLWASPECTHHSVARGGRPRSEQSRASAFLILKWLSEFYVRRVIMENVPEFVTWGPLGSDGKPLKNKRGATFNAFLEALKSLGYRVDWQILCAANYGDPTTRRRFFLQAVRGRERLRWPDPTHAETPGPFGEKSWVPARDIIDWSIRGESIFTRKRPLAPATLRRIEAGIRRYWGEWAEPFLVLLRGTGTARSADDPALTVTAGGTHVGLVEPFMVPFYGERTGQDPRSHSTGEPIPTIPASGGGKFGLVEPFITPYYGDKGMEPRSHSINDPIRTIPTENRFAVVEPFLLSQFGGAIGRGIDKPVRTITTSSRGAGLLEPFLVHYQGNSATGGVRVPLATVTTRDRFGLVEGTAALDITFRMLQPHELAAAQGFPSDYWFAGNKTEKVKQIGNAVPVNTACALARSAFAA